MNNSNNDTAGSAADRAARIVLSRLTAPGNPAVWSLVQSAGAPAALEQLLSGDGPKTLRWVSTLVEAGHIDPSRVAEASLRQAERVGARLVVPHDEEWPDRLSDLAGLRTEASRGFSQNIRPPLCLWVRGFWPLGETLQRSVAVVGARAATDYGLHVTTEIAYGLAKHGWTVVSGGSFGIEAEAHRAALAAEGRTVAVLASGVDRPYPAGNAALLERIAETGLLVSEWPPGAEPQRYRFLLRSRVIAAATVGTVLTEAALRSGATQTMQRVLDLHRTAMVVPGPVTSALSAGCHQLLRSRPDVALVTGLPHVLEALGRGGEHVVVANGSAGPGDGGGSEPDTGNGEQSARELGANGADPS